MEYFYQNLSSYLPQNISCYYNDSLLAFTNICYEYISYNSAGVLVAGFVLYKVYVGSPFNIIRGVYDTGYNHIRGPHRHEELARAVATRNYGAHLPPPYPSGWYALIDSSELKIQTKQAVNALGKNFAVFRGINGVAYVLGAHCPHMGANMAIGGRVVGNCIQCPFHHLQFDGTGRCVQAPGLPMPPPLFVKSWQTREVEGAIWIWFHPFDAPPRWDIQNHEEFRNWGYRGKNEFIVNVHIQDIPENGADSAHFNAVHAETMLPWGMSPSFGRLMGRHHWSTQWASNGDHTATIRIQHHYLLFNYFRIFRVNVDVQQIGPAQVRLLMSTILGSFYICQTVTPLSPMQQRVTHKVYSPTRNAVWAVVFNYIEAVMFARDIVIWNNKTYIHDPRTRLDRNIRRFRIWFRQFYINSNPLDW